MNIPEVPQHQPGDFPPAGEGIHQPSHLRQHGPFGTPSVAVPQRPSNFKPFLFGAVGLLVGLLLGILGTVAVTGLAQAAEAAAAADAEAKKPRPLPAAVNTCKLSGKSTYAKLGDEGRTLSLDGEGEEDVDGLAWTDIQCVLKAVNVPDYVRDQMGSTRALDGTQRESWDNFAVSWSYHPNTGASVVLRVTGE
ncbi:hypothetical protein ACIPY3_19380 [Paenarthrobacter sp. NPDC089714]|uniref:hypothetical protein n=1 Tax=Paenarthrobacter sp. NPDC089714 TaxID=3364377 RepID=UPI0038035F17